MSNVLEETEVRQPDVDNGDKLKAHIVNPPNNLHIWKPGMTSQDVVDIARVRGLEVKALCGVTFIPKHTPDKHDSCEPCFDEAARLMAGNGE